MNDYNFGNLLYELRMKANLTQMELALKLGVTNKAISKWENGNAKPTTDMLKKLSILFNIPIEKLLQIKENDLKRIEIEKRLSKDEYLNLLMNADINKHPIRKTRYCLIYKNQYFEIDIYPFWNDKAIIELELNNEDQEIEFPKQLKLIKEVTHDKNYKNNSLANYK